MLEVLERLEEQHGPGAFYVHAVLRNAFDLQLKGEHEAAYAAADAAYRADLAARVQAGDEGAIEAARLQDHRDIASGLGSTVALTDAGHRTLAARE